MMKSTLSIEEINDIDELRKLINILNNKIELIESGKKALCDLIFRKCKLICPSCHSNSVNKNGKYKGKQNYICKECKKKFNGLTNSVSHHTHLSFKQIEQAFECILHLFSIRKQPKL